jgi:phage FluMu protein Com
MAACVHCGYRGSLAEFRYLGPAEEIGAVSLRRCPACREINYFDEVEEERELRESARPWGLSPVFGRKFTGRDREDAR